MEELKVAGRTLEGVDERDSVWRVDGLEGLAVDGKRPLGEGGLI